MIFKNKLLLTRNKKIVNDVIIQDYIEVKVYSPNGENFIYSYEISVIDISELIKKLEKFKS
jgi:hypothetical protein